MFDKYIIVGEYFKNIEENGNVVGFQFGLRLPYYRGVVLSLIGETKLTVDGEEYPLEKMKVAIGGNTLPMAELINHYDKKWEFGEIGIVTVEKPGGLQSGEHKVEISQHMRISYVPGGFWGSDAKTLQLAV